MRNILLILAILLTVSCGKKKVVDYIYTKVNEKKYTFDSSDPVFDSYKDDFEDDFGLQNENDLLVDEIKLYRIRINFVDKTSLENSVAVCYRWKGGGEIEIQKNYWNKSTETTRKTLIYHELGHCALKRDHKDDKYGVWNISIMNFEVISDKHINNFDTPLTKELFTGNEQDVKTAIDNL